MPNGDAAGFGVDSDSRVGSARYLLALLGLLWVVHAFLTYDVVRDRYERDPERIRIVAQWVALRSWDKQLRRRLSADELSSHEHVLSETAIREEFRLQGRATEPFDFFERAEVLRPASREGPHHVRIAEVSLAPVEGVERRVVTELLSYRGNVPPSFPSDAEQPVPADSTTIVADDLVKALRVQANLARLRLEMVARRGGERVGQDEEGMAIAFLETQESRRYRMSTPLGAQHLPYPKASLLLLGLQFLVLVSLRQRLRNLILSPRSDRRRGSAPPFRRSWLTRRDPRMGSGSPWIMLSNRGGVEWLVAGLWRQWLRFLWCAGVLIAPWWIVFDNAHLTGDFIKAIYVYLPTFLLPLWALANSTADQLARVR